MEPIRISYQVAVQRAYAEARAALRAVEVLANSLREVSPYLPGQLRHEIDYRLATIEGLQLVQMIPGSDNSPRRWVFVERVQLPPLQVVGGGDYCFKHNWSVLKNGLCPCCKSEEEKESHA